MLPIIEQNKERLNNSNLLEQMKNVNPTKYCIIFLLLSPGYVKLISWWLNLNAGSISSRQPIKSNSIKEIEGAFQTLLNAKNQRKSNSIEAALHPIIVNLVSANGNEMFAGKIWDSILEMIPGTQDERKPNEYQTYDYGTIYRNTITNIICDKFGAERGRRKEGSVLTFDPEKLVRVGLLYNLETRIQTKQ